MNRIIRKTVAIVASTVALAGGGLALTAGDASAASRGTATVAEGRKVVREADRQGCLTLKEARKIVKGNGTEYTVEGPTRGWQWKGSGNVRTLDATFIHGCADFVYLDYRHGRTLVWSNWTVGLGSPESY
jgi:hypothetical protein